MYVFEKGSNGLATIVFGTLATIIHRTCEILGDTILRNLKKIRFIANTRDFSNLQIEFLLK